MLIIAVLVTWLLLAVLRGRLHPVGGLGVALGATVLLFPVVQPWYVLWAIIPLAAWATRPRFRTAAIAVTLVVGIFGPTANGDRFTLFQIVARDRGEHAHRAAADRADLLPAAVAQAARRRCGAEPAPEPVEPASYRGRRPSSPTPTLNPRDLRLDRPRAACAGSASGTGRRRPSSELDLDVQRAEVLALLGPNGAGKTTTVEMCEGFIKPDAGTIEILGLDPVADNARVRERIGVMLQGGGGYPAARAGEMLDLVAAYAANPLDPQWLMDTLGLTEAAPHDLPAALRRTAAAAGAGVRGRRPPRAGVPRRADRRHGRARANRGVGVDRRAAPRRRHRGADHPPADRGRGTGRPAS